MVMAYQQPHNYGPPPVQAQGQPMNGQPMYGQPMPGQSMYGPPQGQHMYNPPQNQMQGQMQGQTRGSARFKIVKPSFHSRYECKDDNAPGSSSAYTIEISKNSKKRPDLSLTAGGAILAACYLPKTSEYYNSDPKTFRIGLGDPSTVHWTQMSYQGKDKYGWSFTFNIPPTGQPVPLTWRKDNNVAVDGMSASSLSNNNFKLQDPNGQLMAVFTSHTMSLSLSAVGTLQINMDLGPAFEHAVIISLLAIYDFQKRDEDKRSSATSAAGAAAASG